MECVRRISEDVDSSKQTYLAMCKTILELDWNCDMRQHNMKHDQIGYPIFAPAIKVITASCVRALHLITTQYALGIRTKLPTTMMPKTNGNM